ncbi:uncharacterized protein LOC122947055 [Acropora millepora]|uniref:uncharacterized protein LOC122947055 n=1 Tax=Acropora millepora TaxID=45264 RepID=UPI001CF2A5EA|nr:uncharacterized protein LOC122947055 [Acropora millepora]
MDLAEKLFLHSQVSVKEFSELILEMTPPLQPNFIPSLYAILNSGCFEEYRYFKYKLRYLNSFVPELYNGAECPLCPKENSTDDSLKVLMPALVWQGRKQKVAIQFHQGMGIYCLVTTMMWIILLTIILTVDKSQWFRCIV